MLKKPYEITIQVYADSESQANHMKECISEIMNNINIDSKTLENIKPKDLGKAVAKFSKNPSLAKNAMKVFK